MDQIVNMAGATFQHGRFNDRVYLMKMAAAADAGPVIAAADQLATTANYGKIFAKVRISQENPFLAAGYRREALVPGLYGGSEDGSFLGKYLHPGRMTDPRAAKIAEVLAVAGAKRGRTPIAKRPPFVIRRAEQADARALAELYRAVFKSYPFPIFEPDYLIANMRKQVVYFLAEDAHGMVVAASSMELNPADRNAEMTDFAAAPARRGHSIAAHMLMRMESAAPELGVATAFTIARSLSHGMNAAFARMGYHFGGTLTNNTQIAGHIESMNVWYKTMPQNEPHTHPAQSSSSGSGVK